MITQTRNKEPRFRIGELVVLMDTDTPKPFMVAGIARMASQEGWMRYCYSHSDVEAGWVAESKLAFYIPPELKTRHEDIEKILWQIDMLSERLSDETKALEDQNNGLLPRQIEEEMKRLGKRVSRWK